MSTDDQYKNLKEPTPDSFPHFEEESWRKMEALLDKHLPENNGRVFPYILFFSCLILICLTTFLPANRQQQSADSITMNKTNVLPVEPVSKQKESEEIQSPEAKDKNRSSNNQEIVTNEITPGKEQHSKLKHTVLALTQTERKTSHQKILNSNKIPAAVSEELLPGRAGKAILFNREKNLLLLIKKHDNKSSFIKSKEEIPALKKRVKNSLSLTFSTGLEAPGTAFNTWGRLTPLVGAGLLYSIGDKMVLRTGVYSATKIYSAQDKDYNPANSYWTNYVYFKKIDADCKIIEIPLSVAYKIIKSKKTSMYVSAGASSYIMRKEAYEYYYKNQYGRDTVTTRSWNNNSFHLFSSVNFSAIAERKITNRFSLMAEPIIKIPTGGIGVGRIRLYNAGITVTAKFKLW